MGRTVGCALGAVLVDGDMFALTGGHQVRVLGIDAGRHGASPARYGKEGR